MHQQKSNYSATVWEKVEVDLIQQSTSLFFTLFIKFILNPLIMKKDSYGKLSRQNSSKSLNKHSQNLYNKPNNFNKQSLLNTLQRKRQTGNIFTRTINQPNQSTHKGMIKAEQDLTNKIKFLEEQLKSKICEDGVLRNLFRTKNSSELSHLDIYLQTKKIEQQYLILSKKQQEGQIKIADAVEKLKLQQEDHLNQIAIIGQQIEQKQIQWTKQRRLLQQQLEQLKQKQDNQKYLLQQIKKRNTEISSKYKEVCQELQIERQAKTLENINSQQTFNMKINELKSQNECQYQQLKEKQLQIKELNLMLEKLSTDKREQEQRQKEISRIKKEEKEKYQNYYQAIKQQYEVQIQNLIKDHENELKFARIQLNQLSSQAKQSKNEKDIIDQNYLELKRLHSIIEQKYIILQQKYEQKEDQFGKVEIKNSKLTKQINEVKFQRDQTKLLAEEHTRQNERINIKLDQLQGKIKEVCGINDNLTTQIKEYKQRSEYSFAYNKANDKIYQQNCKTLGRIIEINSKIKEEIKNYTKQSASAIFNQESLSEQVSYLTRLIEQLIKTFKATVITYQYIVRRKVDVTRQMQMILEQCKLCISCEDAKDLISKYLSIDIQTKQNNQQQSQNKSEIFRQLIEILINSQNAKNYQSSNFNRQINFKDSLDSTILQKHMNQSRKNINHSTGRLPSIISNKKEILETQPQFHDYSKDIQVVSDQNKKNQCYNTSRNYLLIEDHSKELNIYPKQIKEKIKSKLPSKKKVNASEMLQKKLQVQRKYFKW